jgi:hypothetical protein
MKQEDINGLAESYINEVWGNQRYSNKPNALDAAAAKAGRSISKSLGFGGTTSGPRNLYGVRTSGSPSPQKPQKPSGTGRPSSATLSALNTPSTQNRFIQDRKPSSTGGSQTRVGAGSLSSGSGAARPATSTKVGGGSMSSGGGKVVPSASMKQTGDKAKDMQTWAKANPTLANKPQRTFNPLMQRTFGYQTGYSPSEVKGNIQKAKVMATLSNSYEWNTKTMKDLKDLYSSVYEAKKVDQDKDGDNDFADVRIARMIASGVPKEVAVQKVKNKPYNEEFETEEIENISSENKTITKEETMYFTEEEAYEIVASYLLEYNFAETINDANNIIENMSASWVGEILDEYVGMIEEERAPGVKPYKPGKTGAEVRAQMRDAEKKRARSGADKKGYGPDEKFYKPEDKRIPNKETADWLRRTKKKFGRPFGKYDPKKIITQDIIKKMPKDK